MTFSKVFDQLTLSGAEAAFTRVYFAKYGRPVLVDSLYRTSQHGKFTAFDVYLDKGKVPDVDFSHNAVQRCQRHEFFFDFEARCEITIITNMGETNSNIPLGLYGNGQLREPLSVTQCNRHNENSRRTLEKASHRHDRTRHGLRFDGDNQPAR